MTAIEWEKIFENMCLSDSELYLEYIQDSYHPL